MHEIIVTYNALVGSQAGADLVEAHATCNESSSVLDNWFFSLNASVMEDNIENDKENVTKDHEECFKEFTPNMPQTNSVWIRLGSEHAYCSCLSHHEVWLIAALALPFFILQSVVTWKKSMKDKTTNKKNEWLSETLKIK